MQSKEGAVKQGKSELFLWVLVGCVGSGGC